MPTLLDHMEATTQETPVGSVIDTMPTERLFTVEEYYSIGEAGIFDADGQVELVEGRIYKLSPKNPLHSATVRTAGKCFEGYTGDKCIVRLQEPVHFDDHSEPEPDVALVKQRNDQYAKSHPTPSDCLLVLEVSLTTLKYDREKKGRIYAAAGIKQYLILNLRKRELEDYRDPGEEGYRNKHTYRADESFDLVAFPGVQIRAGEMLPPEHA